MKRCSVLLLLLAGLGLYAWTFHQHKGPHSDVHGTFLQPALPEEDASAQDPYFEEEFIHLAPQGSMVHVPSLTLLSDGTLVAAWYGGSREGGRDVAVFLSTRKGGLQGPWSAPRAIVDRHSAARELYRPIKKVGNALVFAGEGDRLYLFYVSITVGGWSGSAINLKISDDRGETWSRSQRLTLSPLLNISQLVRDPPQGLSGGGYAVPIYHECVGAFPEVLWFWPGHLGGEMRYGKSRMTGGRRYMQPSLVSYGPHEAVAFLRCMTPDRALGRTGTWDKGASWSKPESLSVPNPDAAVASLLLAGNRLLLVYNDSTYSRDTLDLALSTDLGRTWEKIGTLEKDPEEEFAYPFLVQGTDGLLHLVYTWKRKGIKHVVFNEGWLDQQRGGYP